MRRMKLLAGRIVRFKFAGFLFDELLESLGGVLPSSLPAALETDARIRFDGQQNKILPALQYFNFTRIANGIDDVIMILLQDSTGSSRPELRDRISLANHFPLR